VSDELGDSATPADGFDDVVGEVIGIIAALDAALTALNPTLGDTFAEADTIDAQPVSDTVDGFLPAVAPSDSAVNDLGTLLSVGAAPAPPAPCDVTVTLPTTTVDFTEHTTRLTLTNNLTVPLTVRKAGFTTTDADVLIVAVQIPQTVLPQGILTILVSLLSIRVGVFNGTLTLTTDAPTPSFTVCITAQVLTAGTPLPTGGGGGGGGVPVCIPLQRATDRGLLCE